MNVTLTFCGLKVIFIKLLTLSRTFVTGFVKRLNVNMFAYFYNLKPVAFRYF